MKTALQELLDYVVQNRGDINGGGCYTDIFIEITALLEKEKQQIIDACKEFGNLNGVDDEDFEQYYNKTYNNEP